MSMFHPIMTPELQALRHDTANELSAIYISITVVTTLVVALRFWARWLSKLHFGWDDSFIVAATFFMFCNLAVGLVTVKNGLGIVPTQLFLNEIVTIRKCVLAYEILYVINIALIKFSILIMYCRIFSLHSFRIAAWVLSVATLLWLVAYVFLYIFQCSPVDRAWNPLMLRGHCLDLRGIFVSNAVINIVTDIAILMMPLYHVWRLQLRLVQRITLTLIFMVGCFVIASSIYRFITILRLDRNTNTHNLKEPLVWSHIEICTAIVSGCLPWMRPLLTGFLSKVGLNSKHSTISTPTGGIHQASSGLTRGVSKRQPRATEDESIRSASMELGDTDDRWSDRAKNSQSDVLTIRSIMVITTLEQSVDKRWDTQ